MKRVIAVLLVAAFLAAGAMVAVAQEKGPAEITMSAKMGDVHFNHAAHQEKVPDCTACHHKGIDAGKCTSCHGVDAAAPDAKSAFHDQCKNCHKAQGGPTGCKDCHKK